MQTIESVNEMQSCAVDLRLRGQSIALVPTMGCLHEGHLSLIDLAKNRADKVIVSIFVNPRQFEPNEDFDRYPRALESDLAKCAERGVDFVFNPTVDAMYPQGYSTYVEEEQVSSGLCGISRPSHFRGVATVCLKLFNITCPNSAVFGQKDAQQCALIRKMLSDLNLPVELVIGETMRDANGLAMSSRNQYLTDSQYQEALNIPKALNMGKRMVLEEGVLSVDRVVAEIVHQLLLSRKIRIIYVQIVDRLTMEPASRDITPGKHMICLAVWVDQTRLIDNIFI